MKLVLRTTLLVMTILLGVVVGSADGQVDSGSGNTAFKVCAIHTYGANVDKIIAFVKLCRPFTFISDCLFTTFPGSGDIYVTYRDDADGEFEFRRIAAIVYDLEKSRQTVQLTTSVDVVYKPAYRTHEHHETVLSCRGSTIGDAAMHLDAEISGHRNFARLFAIKSCVIRGLILPTINSDGAVALEVNGMLDLTYRVAGDKTDRRLHTTVSFKGRQSADKGVDVGDTEFEIPDGASHKQLLTVRVIAVAHLVPDAPSKKPYREVLPQLDRQ